MAGKKAPAKQPPAKDEHKEDVQLVPAVQVEEDTDTDGPLPLLPLALFLIPFTSFALALHGLNAAPLYNSLPLLRPLRWAGMLLQVCFLRREETRSLGSLFLLASATTVGALVVGRPAMRLSVHWLGDVEGAAATWLWLATNDMIQAVATVVIVSFKCHRADKLTAVEQAIQDEPSFPLLQRPPCRYAVDRRLGVEANVPMAFALGNHLGL